MHSKLTIVFQFPLLCLTLAIPKTLPSYAESTMTSVVFNVKVQKILLSAYSFTFIRSAVVLQNQRRQLKFYTITASCAAWHCDSCLTCIRQKINSRKNLLMSGHGFCGLSFIALLSPSLRNPIEYCSLQARGQRGRTGQEVLWETV